jgi:hypothetical protein
LGLQNDHANGNGDSYTNGASGDAVGSDSNITPLNGPHTTHAAALVMIHSQVASQGTEVVNVHVADMVIYIFYHCLPEEADNNYADDDHECIGHALLGAWEQAVVLFNVL